MIAAIRGPAQSQEVKITDEALNEIMLQTQGYPYFLQEWGYQAWNIAKKSPIDITDIKKATKKF